MAIIIYLIAYSITALHFRLSLNESKQLQQYVNTIMEITNEHPTAPLLVILITMVLFPLASPFALYQLIKLFLSV